LPQFIGKVKQTPPIYSAIKVGGKTAYKVARKNGIVELPEREVEVLELEISKEEPPYIEIRVKCSKGVYIRALARDFGAKIGCGGHIHSLRRVLCGRYTINNAVKLNEISTLQDIERVLHAPDF
jgi:tRNA pseudouridine55 synthase